MHKHKEPTKVVSFNLTEDVIEAMRPIAEKMHKQGVTGLIDQYGNINKSALIRHLVLKELTK